MNIVLLIVGCLIGSAVTSIYLRNVYEKKIDKIKKEYEIMMIKMHANHEAAMATKI